MIQLYVVSEALSQGSLEQNTQLPCCLSYQCLSSHLPCKLNYSFVWVAIPQQQAQGIISYWSLSVIGISFFIGLQVSMAPSAAK